MVPILAVMFSSIHNASYNALIVGLDYRYVRSHNSYKQILFQTVQRAKQYGCETLDLAYTAVLEKKKLGARTQPMHAYVQFMDHYNQAVIAAYHNQD